MYNDCLEKRSIINHRRDFDMYGVFFCKMVVERQFSLVSREDTVAQPAIYARPTNDYEKVVEVLWQMTDQTTDTLCYGFGHHTVGTVLIASKIYIGDITQIE